MSNVGTGAVYDRGYRPYEGDRGLRGASTYALYKASIRRALGIRRSWRQKFAPFVLLAIVTIPAVVNVGIGYVTRDRGIDRLEIITYRAYVGVSSALLLFVALVAPDVMCPDRRQRVLPLMFARPLTGIDYVVAKVGAITSILFAFSFLPQVVLFVGNMLPRKADRNTHGCRGVHRPTGAKEPGRTSLTASASPRLTTAAPHAHRSSCHIRYSRNNWRIVRALFPTERSGWLDSTDIRCGQSFRLFSGYRHLHRSIISCGLRHAR